MTPLSLNDKPGRVALRVATGVLGALALLLAVLAVVRPDMVNMAMMHRLMSAIGL